MDKKELYRRIAETKAEFKSLFEGQEPVFRRQKDRYTWIFIYPTFGSCVLFKPIEWRWYFFRPNLRLICTESKAKFTRDPMSEVYRHSRVMFDRDGNKILGACRYNSEVTLYLPEVDCFGAYDSFQEYVVDLEFKVQPHFGRVVNEIYRGFWGYPKVTKRDIQHALIRYALKNGKPIPLCCREDYKIYE